MSFLCRLCTAITTLLLLSGCEENSSSVTNAHDGFIYCGANQPDTFNPQLTEGGIVSDTLSSQIFDRLLQLDKDSFMPRPMLATDWQVSEDGKEYLFTLRENVQFQRNALFTPSRPLTAEDVVFSFSRLIDKTHPYHFISGGHYPWFDSLGFAELVSQVEAVGDNQVRFTLKRPDASFLSTLATRYAVIHSAEYAKHLHEKQRSELIDSMPIGTGAFVLDEYQANQFIRLARHPMSWQQPTQMEQVIYDISHRGMGNLTKLITQECDVLSNTKASQLSFIRENDDFRLDAQPAMNLAFLALNTQHPMLNNVAVRQAISFAINRRAIVDSIYHGAGTVAVSILPPASWAHAPSVHASYSPKLARNILAHNGLHQGFSIKLLVPLTPRPYNPSPIKMAELIQADLAAVGIRVTIVPEESFTTLQQRNTEREINDDVGMVLTGWIADSGDPDHFLRPNLSCAAIASGLNLSQWCYPEFEQLLDSAIRIQDREQRKTLYIQQQALLHEKMPIVPIAHGMYHLVVNNELNGFNTTPFGDKSFSQITRSQP